MRPVLILALIVASGAPQTVPDFSGTWTRDPGRSTATGGGNGQRDVEGGGRGGGLGLGPPADQLTIVQTADRLVITERLGEAGSTFTYALNGKRTTNRVSRGRNSGGTAAYVTSRRGSRFVTIVKVPPVGGRGAPAYPVSPLKVKVGCSAIAGRITSFKILIIHDSPPALG